MDNEEVIECPKCKGVGCKECCNGVIAKPNAVDVTTSDNQYRIIQDSTGLLVAHRYGELWRNLAGDNMVLMLTMDLADAREKFNRLAYLVYHNHFGNLDDDELKERHDIIMRWKRDFDKQQAQKP